MDNKDKQKVANDMNNADYSRFILVFGFASMKTNDNQLEYVRIVMTEPTTHSSLPSSIAMVYHYIYTRQIYLPVFSNSSSRTIQPTIQLLLLNKQATENLEIPAMANTTISHRRNLIILIGFCIPRAAFTLQFS